MFQAPVKNVIMLSKDVENNSYKPTKNHSKLARFSPKKEKNSEILAKTQFVISEIPKKFVW